MMIISCVSHRVEDQRVDLACPWFPPSLLNQLEQRILLSLISGKLVTRLASRGVCLKETGLQNSRSDGCLLVSIHLDSPMRPLGMIKAKAGRSSPSAPPSQVPNQPLPPSLRCSPSAGQQRWSLLSWFFSLSVSNSRWFGCNEELILGIKGRGEARAVGTDPSERWREGGERMALSLLLLSLLMLLQLLIS